MKFRKVVLSQNRKLQQVDLETKVLVRYVGECGSRIVRGAKQNTHYFVIRKNTMVGDRRKLKHTTFSMKSTTSNALPDHPTCQSQAVKIHVLHSKRSFSRNRKFIERMNASASIPHSQSLLLSCID